MIKKRKKEGTKKEERKDGKKEKGRKRVVFCLQGIYYHKFCCDYLG